MRWWRSQSYYDSGGWRGTWELDGGGALINQAIHSIDLLQWLMGPVVEVTAYTGLLAHERIEVEDTAVAILKFDSGALGTIVATTAAYPGLTARIAVHGDRGSAIIDDDELDYFHAAGEGRREMPTAPAEARTRPRRSWSGTAGPRPGPARALTLAASRWRTGTRSGLHRGRKGGPRTLRKRRRRAQAARDHGGIYESARTGGPYVSRKNRAGPGGDENASGKGNMTRVDLDGFRR